MRFTHNVTVSIVVATSREWLERVSIRAGSEVDAQADIMSTSAGEEENTFIVHRTR